MQILKYKILKLGQIYKQFKILDVILNFTVLC